MKLLKILRYTPEREREFHEIRVASDTGAASIGQSILYDMATLDAKSAALLTFISVVLASLIFGLSIVDTSNNLGILVRYGFFAFMALFAIAAAIDIRCVYTMGRDDFPENLTKAEFEKVMLHEITLRRRRYSFALQIVRTGGTLLFIFLLAWLVISHFVP